MRTRTFAYALAVGASLLATSAAAQSMWPLRVSGVTFADKKGQIITVGNPYTRSETYELSALDIDFATPISGVTIVPATLTLGAGATRRVQIVFDVPQKERTIAVCVNAAPKEGQMVVPRVCGLYTGQRVGER